MNPSRRALHRHFDLIFAIAAGCTAALCALPSAAMQPVTVDGKRFVQDGKEWVPNGLNYFPAYFPALMPESWLTSGNYRISTVAADLATISHLGINLAAVQGPRFAANVSPEDCRNLNDFLARAQEHGLLVEIYIGGGSLMPFPDPAKLASIPRDCRLAGHPAVFAYEIAWEPLFGHEERRRKLQPAWERWLKARYGSLAVAAAAFGGGYAPPGDKEFCAATSSVRVAAFRRFLDDTLSATYRDARAAIHAVDPTHLIGVRSGYGGNGTETYCADAPVDLRAGAKHLDFVSPEAYGLPRADRAVLLARGGFTAAYADIGKPVFWAEYGVNADGSCAECTESVQAKFYSDFHELVRQTSSNGAAAWWFVGVRPQSRADPEHSDFGIFRDARTGQAPAAADERPAARLLKGALAGVSGARRDYTSWIVVDRDAAAGDWAMYASGTRAYAAAARGEHRIGVRTACTGTTSREVKVCVGNTPFNGSCPAKCLNAEWNRVQILNAAGTWETATDGGSIGVAAGQPVRARLSAGNTGESRWLTNASAGGVAGTVRFGCNENAGDFGCRWDLASDVETLTDVDSGDFVISKGVDRQVRVAFQMVAEGIAWFGERLAITLLPR